MHRFQEPGSTTGLEKYRYNTIQGFIWARVCLLRACGRLPSVVCVDVVLVCFRHCPFETIKANSVLYYSYFVSSRRTRVLMSFSTRYVDIKFTFIVNFRNLLIILLLILGHSGPHILWFAKRFLHCVCSFVHAKVYMFNQTCAYFYGNAAPRSANCRAVSTDVKAHPTLILALKLGISSKHAQRLIMALGVPRSSAPT